MVSLHFNRGSMLERAYRYELPRIVDGYLLADFVDNLCFGIRR